MYPTCSVSAKHVQYLRDCFLPVTLSFFFNYWRLAEHSKVVLGSQAFVICLVSAHSLNWISVEEIHVAARVFLLLQFSFFCIICRRRDRNNRHWTSGLLGRLLATVAKTGHAIYLTRMQSNWTHFSTRTPCGVSPKHSPNHPPQDTVRHSCAKTVP